MDQYILVAKFVRAQLQHLAELKRLQEEEEEGDFDITENSKSTVLFAGHVILGARNTNTSLCSQEESKDPAYKDFSKRLLKWLTANLIHQFNKSAESIKLDPNDKVSI